MTQHIRLGVCTYDHSHDYVFLRKLLTIKGVHTVLLTQVCSTELTTLFYVPKWKLTDYRLGPVVGHLLGIFLYTHSFLYLIFQAKGKGFEKLAIDRKGS